jgi:L-amino acid N-acyltransferase YncA
MTTIRLATLADSEPIAAIYAPFCENTSVSFETVAPAPADMAARIQKITTQYPWLVLESDGVVAGYVYASQHRDRVAYQWSVDVTAYTHPNYRRRGVGKALYTSLFELLSHQGYYKAHAGIALPNPGSIGLHEALGMTLVGIYKGVGFKLDAWHDVAWYQGPLQPQQPDPARPIPITALLNTPQFDQALASGLAYYRG